MSLLPKHYDYKCVPPHLVIICKPMKLDIYAYTHTHIHTQVYEISSMLLNSSGLFKAKNKLDEQVHFPPLAGWAFQVGGVWVTKKAVSTHL